MKLSRRQVMLGLLGLGAARMLPKVGVARAAASPGPAILKPDRERALGACAERILPGALAAGFVPYMNYWLARAPYDKLPDWKPLLRIGAVHLNRIAQQRHQRAFADCTAQQQDQILVSFQQGKIKAKRFQSGSFFQRMVMLTLESFLSDPKYGGNRDGVGFKFVGREHCWWAPKRIHRRVAPKGTW